MAYPTFADEIAAKFAERAATGEALRNQPAAPAMDPRLQGAGANQPSAGQTRADLGLKPAAVEASRVPLQAPVTPANAGAVGSGVNPNVSTPGQSLQAQAYRESLRANPGPSPVAPSGVPAPGVGPAQPFQPNGPSLAQRAGEFLRSDAGSARPAAVPAPGVPLAAPAVAPVVPPVAPAGGAPVFTAGPNGVSTSAPAERSLRERVTYQNPAQQAEMRARLGGGAAAPGTPPGAPPPAAAPAAAPAGATAPGAAPAAPQTIRGQAWQAAKSGSKFVGKAAGIGAPAILEGAEVINVATDPQMTGADVAEQAARGGGKAALSTAGLIAGAKTGAKMPGGPLVKGISSLVGGGLGAVFGNEGFDWLEQKGLDAATGMANLFRAQAGLPPLERQMRTPTPAEQIAAREKPPAGGAKPTPTAGATQPTAMPVSATAPGTAIAGAATDAMSEANVDRQQLARGDAYVTAMRQQLDAAEKSDPGRVLGVGSNNVADPAASYYSTADGRTIRKPVAATPDEAKLAERLRVTEARGTSGTFEHEGRQYANVQYGLDTNGLPVYRAISLDGKAVGDSRQATDLLRRHDEVQQRTGPMSPADAAAVARFEERQNLRSELDRRSPSAQELAEGAVRADATPGAAASPAKGAAAVRTRDTVGAKAAGYQPFSFVQDPQQRSNLQIFGHALAGAEGGTYDKVVGGGSFDDFAKHPGKVGLKTKDGPSTAAGRYQITGTTAKGLAASGKFTDFSPETQDRMFMALLHETGAMNDVVAGNFDAAMQKVGRVWQGVPSGASKNQGKRTPEQWAQLVAEGRQLVGGAQPAAQPGTQLTQAAQAAAQPAWLNPAAGVEVIRPGGQRTQAVPDPNGGAMLEIPQAAYQAVRQAAAADPTLAARLQPTTGGVLVNGQVVPNVVLAAGNAATDEYLGRVRAGAADLVDPQDAKRQIEQAKLQVQANQASSRYIKLKDKDDQGAEKEYLWDTQLGRAVSPATGAPQPTDEDISRLRKVGDKAAFDAFYGAGAADRVLAKSTSTTK
jgi:muramidase (phage lysozyme)